MDPVPQKLPCQTRSLTRNNVAEAWVPGARVAAVLARPPQPSRRFCCGGALVARCGRRCWPSSYSAGSADPAGYDLVVNATPIGMKDDDPLPMDVDGIAPGTFVGEVVMRRTITPFLQAARDKGCPVQVGTDMLFEQIPAYLEFFGLGAATPDELRAVAQIPT